jgi:hypothetical protein
VALHGARGPKPQRDRERADYQTLDRENTLQITSQGWVQAEHNVKRTATGVAVANELGWNESRRVDEGRCRPARDYGDTPGPHIL